MKTIYRRNGAAYGRVVEYHPETAEEHAQLARQYPHCVPFVYICVHEKPPIPLVDLCNQYRSRTR